jgi:hypothetical protein
MPKIAAIVILSLAGALFVTPALAAKPAADTGAAPPVEAGPLKGYECSDEALTGSGPGFKSSQEESEEAALADWLEKAKAVYADADWKTAKGPVMECVKQGLYSKCFATGAPCHPKAQE